MISAKLHRPVSSAVFHKVHIVDGSGDWNEKYCTVVARCEQHGDPSTGLTDRKKKNRLNTARKEPNGSFSVVA